MSNLNKLREDIAAEKQSNAELRAQLAELKKPRADGDAVLKGVSGQAAPYGTSGPILKDSQPFLLTRLIGAQRGHIAAENAKGELDACRKFEKALRDTHADPAQRDAGGMMIPLGMDFLPAETAAHEGSRYMKAVWAAGQDGFDPDEAAWLANKVASGARSGRVFKTAMSYLQDTIGGTLVGPPEQRELIEMIRPRECLMAAGATSVPLPANGKVTWPRQTGPTSFYWVGENVAVTESNPTTGQVVMQARKGGVLSRIPNELFRFASVAADALIRTDMAKTIALGIDYAGLYGSGNAAQPKGLTLFTGTNEVIDYAGTTPTPGGVATNGNALRPEDGYYMIGLLEDRNFEFKGWIMRPTLAQNISGFRADAAAPQDQAGQFVQSMMRAISDKLPGENWCGYPVTKSAVVSASQSKGSATNLTDVFGGQWEHLMVGMYGAVEITSSIHGDSTFPQDQTLVRALVFTDIVPRYEGAFVRYKQVKQR